MKQFTRLLAVTMTAMSFVMSANALNYYTKAIANVSNPDETWQGVYVSADKTDNPEFATTSECQQKSNLPSHKHTYYLYAAEPATGWRFINWTRGSNVQSSNRSCSVSITTPSMFNKTNTETYTANYKPRFVEVAKEGDGSVSISNEWNNLNENVTVTATPMITNTEAVYFMGWYNGENLVSNESSYTLTVKEPMVLTAKFATVSVAAQGKGSASISADGNKAIVNAVPQGMKEDASIGLTGVRNRNIKFLGWFEGETLVSDEETYSFDVEGSKSLTARYEFKENRVSPGCYYRIMGPFNAPMAITGNWDVEMPSITLLTSDAKNCNLWGCLDWKRNPEGFGYGYGDNNIYNDPATIFYVEGDKTRNWGDAYGNNNGLIDDAVLSAQGVKTTPLFHNSYKLKIKWASDLGYHKIRYANDLAGELTFALDGEQDIVKMKQYENDNRAAMRMYFEPVDEEHLDEYWFGAFPEKEMFKYNHYWTSMYTAFPYRCMDGVEAYIVNETGANGAGKPAVYLKKIESGVVPANTPVVLKCPKYIETAEYFESGKRPEAANRLLPLAPDDASINTGEVEGNLLKGVFQLHQARPTDENLSNNAVGHEKYDGKKMRLFAVTSNGMPGFVAPDQQEADVAMTNKVVDRNGEKYLESNSIYLDTTTLGEEVPAEFIMMARDLMTGIDSLKDDSSEAPAIYDIYGRKVSRMQRGGIYVVNGKKIIF